MDLFINYLALALSGMGDGERPYVDDVDERLALVLNHCDEHGLEGLEPWDWRQLYNDDADAA
jgi:hypothetical protein